ncbi:MAG: DUF6279 family lipoprotein [Thiolinea sp.]
MLHFYSASWKKLLEQPELSPAQLQALYDEGWRLIQASSRQLLPDVAELLLGLDEQRRALLANYDRKAREFAQERILPAHEQRRRDRIQRMSDILERWIGDLQSAPAGTGGAVRRNSVTKPLRAWHSASGCG